MTSDEIALFSKSCLNPPIITTSLDYMPVHVLLSIYHISAYLPMLSTLGTIKGRWMSNLSFQPHDQRQKKKKRGTLQFKHRTQLSKIVYWRKTSYTPRAYIYLQRSK